MIRVSSFLFAKLFTGVFAGLFFTHPAIASDIPQFTEQAEAGGITHVYDGDFEYYVGGGAASFDCNNDRLADVFIAGGTNPAGLYVNQSKQGGEIRFAQKPFADEILNATGAYPIHIDTDNHIDLVILRVGENLLYRGLGDCQFAPANATFGFDGGNQWSTGFSAIWEGGAKFPTLAFANYIDRFAADTPWGTCEDNVLMRPKANPANTSTPDYSTPTALHPGFCALSMLFTDWDNQGQFDLRITNDRQYHINGQEQLWHITPNTPPRAYQAKDGWQKLVIWGMGIAEADLNGDGRPEYALSSMGDTMLQQLDEDRDAAAPLYRDIAFESKTTAHRPYVGDDSKPSTGWHTQFADFNNDARLDLFIAKGNVEQMPDFAEYDPDNLLLGGLDGQFVEVGEAAGIALPKRGRGAVVSDFNADGRLDLLVVNRREQVSLFRNLGRKAESDNAESGNADLGNFLAVELQNGMVNPAAIGARIAVKTGNLTQMHRVQSGGGHASGQLGFIHFGLGVAERAEVRVQWPNGDWGPWHRVFADNFVIIDKQTAGVSYWYPPF